MIRIKRIYERPSAEDGTRVLIDRVWPRGLSKGEAGVDLWLKEVAPSTELRKWFNHDPERWPEFRRRYIAELEAADVPLDRLEQIARDGDLTLLYATRDERHNNAQVLKELLEARLAQG